MGEMRRAIAREVQQRQKQERFASTLVISTSIIAAARLAREPEIGNTPRVVSAVSDSIALARMILDRILR